MDAIAETEVVPPRDPVDVEDVGIGKGSLSRVADALMSITTLFAGMVVPCSVTSRVL